MSLTSFGGPSGHLISFIRIFENQKGLFTKDEILNLHSYCSILPGATSTQLLCLLAYRKGGLMLCFVSFLIWIFPVSIIMFSTSFFLSKYNLNSSTETYFAFFQPMIIAFMFSNVLKLYKTHFVPYTHKYLFLINIATIIIFIKHPFILPFTFMINGLISAKSSGVRQLRKSLPFKSLNIQKPFFYVFILIFTVSAFMSEYSRKYNISNRYLFNIIEHNYRHGSMVYGGGDVLIPIIYEQYVSRPTSRIIKRRNPAVLSLTKDEIVAGAGLIRFMPGPVFSIVSFTTPLLVKDYSAQQKLFTTIIATLFIYIPGILIVLSFYPVWYIISSDQNFASFLKGINLAVFSIICATSLYFLVDLTIHSNNINILLIQYITILLTVYMLNKWRINHALIALMCLTFGFIYHFL